MKRDLAAFMGALTITAVLAIPTLAAAAEPATSPEASALFPSTLTDAGKQFLDRCSDEQLAGASDPLLESSRCHALYKQWFAQAGESVPRGERSRTLQPNIPFRSVARRIPNRAL
jgi:hypothetical protein